MDECSICLLELHGDRIDLKCKHFFHKTCLSQLHIWKCPICRDDIDIEKLFNINKNQICDENINTHFGFGYAPVSENGFCRFCRKKSIKSILHDV